jgi:broad specificity phosphatase PhoE
MAPLTRILLVRHGQSTWNAIGRWQGQADAPLSDLGRTQAKTAGAVLVEDEDGVTAVVSSDLTRARETADVLAVALGVPVEVEPRLRESATGEWTGLTHAEIERTWPGWIAAGRRPAGFEPWPDVAERASAALVAIAARHAGATVIAVAHGGALRCLEHRLGVDSPVVPNLGGRWFTVVDGVIAPGEPALLVDRSVAVTVPDVEA